MVNDTGRDNNIRTGGGAVIEGDVSFASVSGNVQNAVGFYRDLMQDFAKRLGLPSWQNYMTHVTNKDAYWQIIRDKLIKDPGAFHQKLTGGKGRVVPANLITPDEFKNAIRYAHDYNVEWHKIPGEVRNFIERKLFRWDTPDWDKLPESRSIHATISGLSIARDV